MTLPEYTSAKLEKWTSKLKLGKKDVKVNDPGKDLIPQPKPPIQNDIPSTPAECTSICVCCGKALRYPAEINRVKCLYCRTYISLDSTSSSTPKDTTEFSYKTFKHTLKDENHCIKLVSYTFGSTDNLNFAFVNNIEKTVSYDTPNLNFHDIGKFYTKLTTQPSDKMIEKVSQLSLHLLKRPPSIIKPDKLNWILIILENPLLFKSLSESSGLSKRLRLICYDILKRIVGILSNLPADSLSYFLHWWSRLPNNEFENKVNLFNSYLTFHINRLRMHAIYEKAGIRTNLQDTEDDINYKNNYNLDISQYYSVQIPNTLYSESWHLNSVCQLLSFMKSINNKYPKMKDTAFYNTSIEYINMVQDFDIWQINNQSFYKETNLTSLTENMLMMDSQKEYLGVSQYDGVYRCSRFTICNYSFLIPLSSKINVLEKDSKKAMGRLAEEAIISSMIEGKNKKNDMFLRLCVNRNNITKDSLSQLMKKSGDVKKQLRIQFVDEPGIDAGGIKKEWFSLIIDDIFDPRRGLIDYNNELGYANLSSTSKHFRLIYLLGEIIGMAITNCIMLNIKFPRLMYKKLLGYKTEFIDLHESEPTIFSNLRKMLKMENVEVLDLTFEITYAGKDYELIPNGKNVPVINGNKRLYADKYASFILDERISKQFEHFAKGFYNVMNSKSLKLFSPREVQKLIVGDENDNRKYDLNILKVVTIYTGCTEDDPVINWFWEFFNELGVKMQHKLMKFITGTDMIPALGIHAMKFKVTKTKDVDGCNERLPVSHTCFNEICISEYETKQVLVDKFLMAINESEGFTLK